MLSIATTKLIQFRNDLYSLFPKRSDAIMNLLDALSGQKQRCNSVVQLSSSPHFNRQYSSITDAISDGLPEGNWSDIQKLMHEQLSSKGTLPHRFLIDCTGNPRPHARKLADRHITHTPNPAPGNKPIAVGHQYSMLTSLPNDPLENEAHWLLPLSAVRVKSGEKGHEVGMKQVVDTMNALKLTNELTLSIGDSLYGTEACRVEASTQENLIHLFRLNSKRNLFYPPPPSSQTGKAGRHKEFGRKMKLGDPSTYAPCDERASTQWTSRRGRSYSVTINSWHNMLLRGSRAFRSSQHPLTLIRVDVTDESGKALYKRPLWLAVFGKRRHELSLIDAYESYRSRYDIEHYFRFSKRHLLMDGYQTADVEHEELWWSLCLLAYGQLYLAKEMVSLLPQPWERYLPVYRRGEVEGGQVRITTPSQTQRGFSDVLNSIGTPARRAIARGKPRGRMAGENPHKRDDQTVVFKSQKRAKKALGDILQGFDSTSSCSTPQKIEELIQHVQESLGKLNITPSEFIKMLINSS